MIDPRTKVVEAAELRAIRSPPPEPPPLAEAPQPTVADYVALVLGARWFIVAVAIPVVLLGVAYVVFAPPKYRADFLVQVEEKAQGLGFEELSTVFGGKAPAETEIEIIRSRSLVNSVIDELALDVVAKPRRFPIVGGAFARWHEAPKPREPVLGLEHFAWGGERLRLVRLDLPRKLMGETLTLVAGEGGAYALHGPDDELLVTGKVGEVAAGERGVAIVVKELVARPGTEFVVRRELRAEVIEELQESLRISEKGKKTGILQVSLFGPEPARITAILDAVSRSYLRQNVERKSAEAQKTLEFLETQLPELKANLDAAESALEEYRKSHGTVNVSLETDSMLKHAVDVEKALSELQVQRQELASRFTESHPVMQSVAKKIASLRAEREAIEGKVKALPKAELESARLMRDAQVANELYVLLLNKAQELKVVKSGTIGNVRILDAPMEPVKPVAPNKPLALAFSLVLGLGLGVALTFVRKALSRGMEDPEAIERDTGIAVYASIPRSEQELRLERRREQDKLLAATDPNDVAVESFRSLRTSLQFALVEAPRRVVTVVGPAPTIGKSFCSANLGAVLAESGRRAVVVDADLRKGRLHHYLGGTREHGLSELISGELTYEQVIRPTLFPGLDFVATGKLPPNPAGLLGSERFQTVLEELSKRYDYVVIDTAPVLAVTDAVLVGRHAGVNLMVLRAGKHPLREINAALRRFGQAGVEVHGVVLNDVQPRMGHGGAYHYQYEYGHRRGKAKA